MPSLSKKGNRFYPSLPEITADSVSHTNALQQIKTALRTYQREDSNYLKSFIRFEELVELGIIDSSGEFILSQGSDITFTSLITNDVDVDGGSQGDLLFNADGTEWQVTGPNFRWKGTHIQLGPDVSIDWDDSVGDGIELLTFGGTEQPTVAEGYVIVSMSHTGNNHDVAITSDGGATYSYYGYPGLHNNNTSAFIDYNPVTSTWAKFGGYLNSNDNVAAKSVNDGVTWTYVDNVLAPGGPQFDPRGAGCVKELGLWWWTSALGTWTSPDLDTWTAPTGLPGGSTWSWLAYDPVGGNAAIGGSTRTYYSTDGLVSFSIANENDSMACGVWCGEPFNVFVAVTSDNTDTSYTSPDGATWTKRLGNMAGNPAPTADTIAWSPLHERVVYVGRSTSPTGDTCQYSDDGGVTWVLSTTSISESFQLKVIWVPSEELFMAHEITSNTQADVWTSPDGDVWTKAPRPVHNAGIYAMGYAETAPAGTETVDEFFVVGDPNYVTKIDGSAITLHDEYTFPVADGTAGQSIITDGAGNLSFASVGESSFNDGLYVHIEGFEYILGAKQFNDFLFMNAPLVMLGFNGIQWDTEIDTATFLQLAPTVTAQDASGTMIAAAANLNDDPGQLARSVDGGTSWTVYPIAGTNQTLATAAVMVYADHLSTWYCFSGFFTYAGAKSTDDGLTWTTYNPVSDPFSTYTVRWAQYIPELERMFHCSTNLETAYSDDGLNWTQITTANGWPTLNDTLTTMAYSPTLGSGQGRLVAGFSAAGSALPYYSDDGGVTWSPGNVALGGGQSSILWLPEFGWFVAITGGNSEDMAISTNGISWTNYPSNLPTSSAPGLRGTAYDPVSKRLVIVGVSTPPSGYSDDGGLTWSAGGTELPVTGGVIGYNVIWNVEHSLFVCMRRDNSGSAGTVWTSPDATAWTQVATPTHDSGLKDILFATLTPPVTAVETFLVGDPAYPTQIDGTITTVTGALSVDGAATLQTTLNVLGASTLENVQAAATTLESLDVLGLSTLGVVDAGATTLDSLVVQGNASIEGVKLTMADGSAINWSDTGGETTLIEQLGGAPTGDEYWDLVTLHADFDGTDGATSFTTEDPGARTVTFVGTAQLDTAIKKNGTAALLLDGNSDYCTVPHTTDLTLNATEDMTVEAWVRKDTVTGNNATVVNKGGVFGTTFPNYALNVNSSSQVNFGVYHSSGVIGVASGTTTVAVDTWYHLAGTWEAATDTVKVYLNGILEGTTVGTTDTPFSSNTNNLNIGFQPSAPSGWFPGTIDDVRITRGLRYTSNFTPPAVPNDTFAPGSAYWSNVAVQCNFDGADAATSYTSEDAGLRTATFVGNAQLDTAQFVFGTAALLCDGTGDYVTFPDSTDYEFGAADFTAQCRVRFNGDPGTANMAFMGQYLDTGDQRGWSFILRNNTLEFNWSTDGTAATFGSVSETWNPAGNTWYHVAVSRTGGFIYLFVDGVLLGTGTANTATIFAPATQLAVGGVTSAFWDFNGWIDDLEIVNGTGLYDATFTPSIVANFNGPVAPTTSVFTIGDPTYETHIDGDGIALNSSLAVAVTTVTATSYTAANEHVILVDDDTAAAAVTVTLPAAAPANTMYHIKKLGTTANVIIDGNASETIDGALTATLTIQYESIMLVSNGTFWSII